MAARKSSSTDFESRYFDLLIDRLDKQDEVQEKILEQVRYTNGRVTKLEETVHNTPPPAKKDLPSVLRDPKFLQIVLYLSLALLLVIAAFTGFDIKGLLS